MTEKKEETNLNKNIADTLDLLGVDKTDLQSLVLKSLGKDITSCMESFGEVHRKVQRAKTLFDKSFSKKVDKAMASYIEALYKEFTGQGAPVDLSGSETFSEDEEQEERPVREPNKKTNKKPQTAVNRSTERKEGSIEGKPEPIPGFDAPFQETMRKTTSNNEVKSANQDLPRTNVDGARKSGSIKTLDQIPEKSKLVSSSIHCEDCGWAGPAKNANKTINGSVIKVFCPDCEEIIPA